MRAVRHRVRRSVGAALLAALLLLPLAFSGHDHGGDLGRARTCGTCIAVRHSPSLQAAAVTPAAPHVLALTFVPTVALAPVTGVSPRRVGRAPPAVPVVTFV